ncbi:unnamed protein product, partial [Dicrocoelium dendriticum]
MRTIGENTASACYKGPINPERKLIILPSKTECKHQTFPQTPFTHALDTTPAVSTNEFDSPL